MILSTQVNHIPALPPSSEIAGSSKSSRWAAEVCQQVDLLLEAYATRLDTKRASTVKLDSKHQIISLQVDSGSRKVPQCAFIQLEQSTVHRKSP